MSPMEHGLLTNSYHVLSLSCSINVENQGGSSQWQSVVVVEDAGQYSLKTSRVLAGAGTMDPGRKHPSAHFSKS